MSIETIQTIQVVLIWTECNKANILGDVNSDVNEYLNPDVDVDVLIDVNVDDSVTIIYTTWRISYA